MSEGPPDVASEPGETLEDEIWKLYDENIQIILQIELNIRQLNAEGGSSEDRNGTLEDEIERLLDENSRILSSIEYSTYLLYAQSKLDSKIEANDCPKKNLEDFEISGHVGSGYYALIFQAQLKSGEIFAIKVQDKYKTVSRGLTAFVIREKKLTYGFDSPFIVKTLFAFQDTHNLYMVMEHAIYGDLERNAPAIIDFASEELLKLIAAQIVLALEYVHACHYIHNDLRPANVVLFGDGYLKVCDWGLAISFIDATYIFRAEERMPPEVRKQELQPFAIDWWELGYILQSLSRRPNPLHDIDPDQEFDEDGDGGSDSGFSDEFRDFLKRLLEPDTTRRLGATIKGARDVKKHPWFNTVDFLDVYFKRIPMMSKLPPNLTAVQADASVQIPKSTETITDGGIFEEF